RNHSRGRKQRGARPGGKIENAGDLCLRRALEDFRKPPPVGSERGRQPRRQVSCAIVPGLNGGRGKIGGAVATSEFSGRTGQRSPLHSLRFLLDRGQQFLRPAPYVKL